MRLRERYRRLTLWNKLGVWGSIASLVGLAWTFWPSNDDTARDIAYLAGRDSFVYLIPQPNDDAGNVPLAIRSVGRNSLVGVRLTIRDLSPGEPFPPSEHIVDFGTIPADTVQSFPQFSLKASSVPGTRLYAIQISTQAGEFSQEIRLRTEDAGQGRGCLADMTVVTKNPRISEIGKGPSVFLKAQDWHYYVPCQKSE